MVGTHLLKCWSSTQAGVAMSSGEAEFYGAVKGASAGLGMKALYGDIGYHLPLRLWTDSSAAIGIASRQGLGKLRHLECTSLWLQQRLRQRDLEIRKIAGENNPADLYTKHLESKAKIEQLIGLFGGEFREGRASSAPMLKKDNGGVNLCDMNEDDVDDEQALIHDSNVLPHLMTQEDIEVHFPIVKIPDAADGEPDLRPEVELADPGPRGRLDLTPAMFREDDPVHSHGRAFLVTSTPITPHARASTVTNMSPDTGDDLTVNGLATQPELRDASVQAGATADTQHQPLPEAHCETKGSKGQGLSERCKARGDNDHERRREDELTGSCDASHQTDGRKSIGEPADEHLRGHPTGIFHFCRHQCRGDVSTPASFIFCQSPLQSASRDDSLVKSPGGLQSRVRHPLSPYDPNHHNLYGSVVCTIRGGVFGHDAFGGQYGSRTNNDQLYFG